jgi:hypothetical protein
MKNDVEIVFANKADESKIVRFLREHWRRNHIFVTNPEVMRWQHQSPSPLSDQLTFVYAQRKNNNDQQEILALLGYIPFRRFDNSANWSEIALAIWKVRDDAGMPGLGLQLLKNIQRQLIPGMICAIGISQIVKPIYLALGYTVSSLSHFALFSQNRSVADGVASGIPSEAWRDLVINSSVKLESVDEKNHSAIISPDYFDRLGDMSLPRKSWRYVIERYLRHPWYQYDVRMVVVDGRPKACIVWRRVSVAEGSVLRIVDVIGNVEVLEYCGNAFREILDEQRSQYIDLMQWGIAEKILKKAGFVSSKDYPDLVIPNYFSPYEKRNIQIDIAFKVSPDFKDRRVYLFRADSDQDRPNQSLELL